MRVLRKMWAGAEWCSSLVFDWINRSKFFKLVGVAWVVWLSLSNQWDLRQSREKELLREQREIQREAARKREEAALHGTDREPQLYMDFGPFAGGATVCRATNTDSRELFSVSISFGRFISSNVGVHIEGPSHRFPETSVAVLRPWQTLEARFPAKVQKYLCDRYTPPCTLDQRECAIFIRCELRAHRQYDMRPTVRAVWGALKPNCTEVVDLRTLAQASGTAESMRLFWQTDERLLRAFRRIRVEQEQRTTTGFSALRGLFDGSIEEMLEKFPVETINDPFPWPQLEKPAKSPAPAPTARR